MTYWIIPSNLKRYDALSAFDKHQKIDWGNATNHKFDIGDVVYIYVSDPIRQIKLKTEVIKTNYGADELLGNDEEFFNEEITTVKKYFRLKLLKVFNNNESALMSHEILKNHGLNGNIQGKMRLPEPLAEYIMSIEKGTPMKKLNASLPKNIILYGPPGVGKTYSHKKLISILENGDNLEELENPDYKTLSFDTVKAEGRYQFLTFHQSYSYEDFVEGFRPNEDGKIVREDGIFKNISYKAKKNLIDSFKPIQTVEQEKTFDQLFQEFVDHVQLSIDEKSKYVLTENVYIFEVEDNAFRYKGDNWSRHDSGIRMRFDILKDMYLHNVKSRKDIKQLDQIGGLASQHATYFWELLNKFYTFSSTSESKKIATLSKDSNQIELKNYYLIIDEINRGNISKIFGELITLLEEDKRLGEDNELTVTLPYSKEPFGIPKNLYIIGTMNTADKSIALVDIALRRRFTFVRMEPIEEYLSEKVKKINNIIKDRRGADYLIGHAYFIDKDGSKIDETHPKYSFVMKYKIRPLLEEYFYGEDIETIFGELL